MLTVSEFYDPENVTLPFWAWGDLYTVVKNRHIGVDIGTNRKPISVPALKGGVVTQKTLTGAMAWVIEILADDGFYYAYCHLANDRLPRKGQRIKQGQRVGRLAAGPANLSPRNPDFPGRAWTGIHLHLVVSNTTKGSYIAPRRAGTLFYDPERIMRAVLSQIAADSKPKPLPTPKPEPVIVPEEEDDGMYRPTVHVRLEPFEATRAHPFIGRDLAQHTGPGTGGKRVSSDGKVTTYRGFQVTADRDIATAWARTHAKGAGGETSRTDRDGYIAIQIEASRLSVELTA